ncbi:MAG: hypothetical protein ACTSQI_13795 [Candidatus Helarchaeota archaeon]
MSHILRSWPPPEGGTGNPPPAKWGRSVPSLSILIYKLRPSYSTALY